MLQAYYGKQGIDAVYDAFRSKGFSAEWTIRGCDGAPVSMASLPPFLRTLLMTDGTVTKSLEAYYWEPVQVRTLSQQVQPLDGDIHWLGAKAGEPVITRRVQLCGVQSGTLYAEAFSLIRPGLIPEGLRQRLLDGSLGLGELIRDCGLETYRELLEIGMDSESDRPASQTGEAVHRSYRIIMAHQPAILVTEHFPLAVFAAS